MRAISGSDVSTPYYCGPSSFFNNIVISETHCIILNNNKTQYTTENKTEKLRGRSSAVAAPPDQLLDPDGYRPPRAKTAERVCII